MQIITKLIERQFITQLDILHNLSKILEVVFFLILVIEPAIIAHQIAVAFFEFLAQVVEHFHSAALEFVFAEGKHSVQLKSGIKGLCFQVADQEMLHC
jgi:hypothetical protein